MIFDHQWELEKLTRLEEVGRVRHLLMLRERLGMDMTPNPTTKTEKDVCNLAARANQSPVHNMVIPPSPQTPVRDPTNMDRDYTPREQDLVKRCVKLIQGRIGMKDEPAGNDTDVTPSPAEDGVPDLTVSYISDLISPQGYVDVPNGWEPPPPPIQLEAPLRLYVPDLEEIRVSPVVSIKFVLNK